MPIKTNGKPRPRGFAAMNEKTKLRICAMGGKATAKKLGRAHMSRIGKRGRAKRTRNERKAKRQCDRCGADVREKQPAI